MTLREGFENEIAKSFIGFISKVCIFAASYEVKAKVLKGKTRLGIQPPILNTFSFTRKLSRGTYSVKSGRVLQFPFNMALTPKLTSYENNDHTFSEAPFRSGCR